MGERAAIGFSDLAGARVGVWGLGTEARASLRRLATLGITPVLVDDRPQPAMDELGTVTATADGGWELLAGCEVVIKAPGIPRRRPEVATLTDAGVAVVGGLGLWLAEVDRDRVICVTGTKGKSTTVSVAGHLARGLGLQVVVGGNLGTPPFDPSAPQDAELWVIEVSSYQATDLAHSPPVVAVTSLSPDHLPWHGDVDRYERDKLSLASQPGARTTVIAGEDPRLLARLELLGPEVIAVTPPPDGPPAWFAQLGLAGRHNLVNALIARRCLVAAGVEAARDDERLAPLAGGFSGLDSRLEVVGSLPGSGSGPGPGTEVTFIDDSLSTNVLSALAALEAQGDRPVALLAGGDDRGIDLAPLADALVARSARGARTLLVALPTTGARLAAVTRAAAQQAGAPDAPDDDAGVEVVEIAADGAGEVWMQRAVAQAYGWAAPRGGVVLLSPAAPSFDHFRDYRDRGAAFAAAMRAVGA